MKTQTQSQKIQIPEPCKNPEFWRANFAGLMYYQSTQLDHANEDNPKGRGGMPATAYKLIRILTDRCNSNQSVSVYFPRQEAIDKVGYKNAKQYETDCDLLKKYNLLEWKKGVNNAKKRLFLLIFSSNFLTTFLQDSHNIPATFTNIKNIKSIKKDKNLKKEREENSPPSQEKIFEKENSPTPNPIQASTDTEKGEGGGVRIKSKTKEQSNFHTFAHSEYADKAKFIAFCEEIHPNKDFSAFADNFINKHADIEEHATKRLNKKGWGEKILEWLKLEKKAIPAEKKAPKTVTEAGNFTKTLADTQKAFNKEISKIGNMSLHDVDYDMKMLIVFTDEAEYERIENTESAINLIRAEINTYFGLDWNIGYVLPVEEEKPVKTEENSFSKEFLKDLGKNYKKQHAKNH